MRKRILMIALPLAALILEMLPYGAVCIFALDKGQRLRQTFSYFDLTPFGYANFGPFITALLTCILLGLAVIYVLKPGKRMNTAIRTVSGFAVAAAYAPLMLGVSFMSVIGLFVGLLLAAVFGVSFISENSLQQKTEMRDSDQ